MTPADIKRMAREAGDAETDSRGRVTFSFDSYGLARFAALVEAENRERCATVCEAMIDIKEQERADLAATNALKSGSQRDKIDRLSHQGVVNLFNRTLERCAAAIRGAA